MDGSNRPIEVDSASTAQEVVTQISTNLGIVDTFGFSIYVKLSDKVCIPVGSCSRVTLSISILGNVYRKRSGAYHGCNLKL